MQHSFLRVLIPDYIQTQYVLFLKIPFLADGLLRETASEGQGGDRVHHADVWP